MGHIYYRLDRGEKVITQTEIPQEQWEKKQILPYRQVTITDEVYEDDLGIIILENEVQFIEHKPIIPKTLQELKDIKNEELKRTLNELMNEGFECSNGIKVDCRESDKINWLGASMDDSLKTTVKDYNNQLHSVTIEEFDIMYNELKGYYNKLIKDKWTLNELVNVATTQEEVEAIYWRKAHYKDEEIMEFDYWEYNPILEE